MALSDLVIPTVEIPVGTTTISVRGITARDVAYLYTHERALIDKARALWESSGGEVSDDFITALVVQLPELVAKVIACASDSPDMWEKALLLPIPAQVEAINAIGTLTFEGIGVKKFLEAAILLVQGMAVGVRELAPQKTGTGG